MTTCQNFRRGNSGWGGGESQVLPLTLYGFLELVLYHWCRTTEEDKDYPFVQFSSCSDEEYTVSY